MGLKPKDGWDRHFDQPIHLADGTTFRSLRDAAGWIINNQPPNAETAVARLMEAAEQGGPLDAAETAVRLALFARLDFRGG